MKRGDVKVGGTYKARIKGKEVRVRIEGVRSTGGWDAKNLANQLTVKIPDAKGLKPLEEADDTPAEPTEPPKVKNGSSKAQADPAPVTTDVTSEVPPPAAPEPEAVAQPSTPKKLSAIDAAAKVLAEAGTPMNTKQMVEAMATKGYWTSPGGKTPQATLYSAILREIASKGAEARFVKTDRGTFAAKA